MTKKIIDEITGKYDKILEHEAKTILNTELAKEKSDVQSAGPSFVLSQS